MAGAPLANPLRIRASGIALSEEHHLSSLLDLNFCIAVVVLLFVLRLSSIQSTRWFGLCNLAALWWWLGIAVTLTALGFSVFFWGLLSCSVRLEGRKRRINVVSGFITMILILLFLVHKIDLEYSHLIKPLQNSGRWQLPHMLLASLGALSVSYVVLRAYDMASTVLRDRTSLRDPLTCLGFLFPFHMLIAGPINRYQEHLEIDRPGESQTPPQQFLLSANDIAMGLLYKYVVCEYMRIFVFGPSGPIQVHSIFDTAYLLVYVFFDFAGYSAIALGVGRLLGIPTPRNFNAPFVATTVTEFFTRWHASLGTFIQRHVYSPIQIFLVRAWGIKQAVWAGIIALFVSWSIVGLWHRLSVAFFLYGVSMTVWIWLEKLLRDRLLKASWSRHWIARWTGSVLGPVYVFLAVTLMLHPVSKELFAP